MKIHFLKAGFTLCIVAIGSVAQSAEKTTVPAATTVANTNGVGPKIQFADPSYEFGRVTAGTLVKHDFIFTNIGDATLQITAVNPGCGCTTISDWTHQVEPGKTGVIPIQFNSANYNTMVTKMPSISCNDTNQPTVILKLHGIVFKPVEVTPPFVTLSPDPKGNATATVHIVSNEEQPLILSTPQSFLHAFAVEVKTNTPGKDFSLIIKTVPPLNPGTTQGMITVHTSSTNVPDISIMTMATVQQPAAPPTVQPATNVSIQVMPPAK